jgi:hypothetical protein
MSLVNRNAGIAVQKSAITRLAFGEGAKKLEDARHEEEDQRKNGTELNHDGVHLPVRIGQVEV